jgi:hypothetical protein
MQRHLYCTALPRNLVNKNVAERSFNLSPSDEKVARSNLRKENVGARGAKNKRRQIEIQGNCPGASRV